MALNISLPEKGALRPRIKVFGVGGAGSNAVNNMVESGLEGVEFVVANTDAQALEASPAQRRIQLGGDITEGLGAGGRPEVGRAAAEESIDEIVDAVESAHMVFVTAGMGGGTGTGAASVVARVARELGILTVGVVTKPFLFEGARRMATAEKGLTALEPNVDTLLVIPNQNLFRVSNERTTLAEAFAMADKVLYTGVSGITNLMVKPGVINLDFADVRSIMNEMGKAMMGAGEASGERRAVEAAEQAINNPLLDDVSMRGARGVLISVTGGQDMTLYEVDEAANRVRNEVDPEANIIVGSAFDDTMDGAVRVSVVATGIEEAAEIKGAFPRSRAAPEAEAVEDFDSVPVDADEAEDEAELEVYEDDPHTEYEDDAEDYAEGVAPPARRRTKGQGAHLRVATPSPPESVKKPAKRGFFGRMFGRSRARDLEAARAGEPTLAAAAPRQASPVPSRRTRPAAQAQRAQDTGEDDAIAIPDFLRRSSR